MDSEVVGYKKFKVVDVIEGKFWVVIPEEYEVNTDKVAQPIDQEIIDKYPDITWLTNFGVYDPKGEIPRKLDFKYEIRVKNPFPLEDGRELDIKELFDWDGEFAVRLTEEFHDVREITELSGEKYIRAKISLTDPPCGGR